MTTLRKAGLAIAALVVISQLIPLDRTNPPGRYDGPILGGLNDRQLRTSCYACHSNRTEWPWYGDVTPGRFLVARDVDEGRAELNFDEWAAMPADRRRKALRKSAEELREGEMPTPPYLLLHPGARLSESQKRDLLDALVRAAR